ncbi:MAG: glycosyltransferase family 2 protein, partial [Planctomycetota bacterium]
MNVRPHQPSDDRSSPAPDVSVVVPMLNEEASLGELHRQLLAMADSRGYELQVVFVDDGSTDGSWAEVERLAAAHDGTSGVRFRRNFGKAAALSAGFAEATAPVIVTMDADLQDDPAEVPRLIAELRTDPGADGYDVVSGWKKTRLDPWHKRWPSLVFNGLVSRLTKVRLHDHNCGLKAYRREVLDEVRLYGELHRFVPVLAAARGY